MLLLGDDPIYGPRAPVPHGARRALAIFGAVALGIVLTRWLLGLGITIPSGVWLGAAGCAVACALVVPARWCGVVLLCSIVLGSLGFTSLRWFEPPAHSLMARLPADIGTGDRMPVRLRGLIATVPQRGAAPAGELAELAPFSGRADRPWVYELAVSHAESDQGWLKASGRVWVIATGRNAPQVLPGEVVEMIGLFAPLRRPLNPGSLDGRLWGAERGRVGTLSIGQDAVVHGLGRAQGIDAVRSWWWRWRTDLRARAMLALSGPDDGSQPTEFDQGRSVVEALVLGERDPRAWAVQGAFARQGVAHLLAISGFHLLVVSSAALFATRVLTGGRWGAVEPLVIALVIVGFLVLVPSRPPNVRAAVMALALLGSQAASRRYHGLGVIAWVGVLMLAWRPTDLFNAGFQLSFLMTAALIWLGSRVDAVVARRRLDAAHVPADMLDRAWWWGVVRTPFSASLLCWMVGAPLIAAVFGWLSPLAIISTLVLLPGAGLILIAGACAVVLEWVCALLGVPSLQIGSVLSAVGSWCAALVLAVDGWGWTTWRIPWLPGWLGWLGTALVLAWMGGTQRSRRVLMLLSIGWVATACAIVAWPRVSGPQLRLDVFAVGDGTCYLVRSGGESLLWDAGSTSPGVGVWELPRAMRSVGVGRVRTVVITHANYDHYSALPDLIEPLGIERVLVSESFLARADAPATAKLLQVLEREGVVVSTLHAGDEILLGTARLEVLQPAKGQVFEQVNDESLVVRITANGGGHVLLTGDIQRGAMEALQAQANQVVAQQDLLSADVMELPHHGSSNATAREFVERVNPGVVLQSTGTQRVGDERWDPSKRGRVWRTTATDGWTSVEMKGASISVRSMYAPTITVPLADPPEEISVPR